MRDFFFILQSENQAEDIIFAPQNLNSYTITNPPIKFNN